MDRPGHPCCLILYPAVIQFARLSGYSPIITTASVKNTEYLLSLGATHVLDRNLSVSSLRAAVKEITTKPFPLVYDAVSSDETQNAGYDLLASGGTLVAVLQTAVTEDKLTPDKRVTCISGNPFPADRRPLSVEMYKQLPAMFERGDLKVCSSRYPFGYQVLTTHRLQPNKVEIVPNGFAGIPEGLERLRRNEVSARKLVARPQESP